MAASHARARRRAHDALPLFLYLVTSACAGDAQPARVVLGTTHTIEDSGLLDVLTGAYAAEPDHYPVAAIVAGSGEVLRMAMRGDIDVVLSHSPDAEMELVREGYAESRQPVMRSEFLLLGPPADPAGVDTLSDAAAALRRIAGHAAPFISRGDDSGTHARERTLWRNASVTPAWDGYVEAGAGMADALRLASRRAAYILSDRPTFELLRDQLQLAVLVDGDSSLHNPYSVLVIADARNSEGARHFAAWLRGARAQRLIVEYGRAHIGGPLFVPVAADTPEA